MTIELIATLNPSGSSVATFTSIPTIYSRLKVIGSISVTNGGTVGQISFGNGNASDYIYASANTAGPGTASTNLGGYGVAQFAYAANDNSNYTSVQTRSVIVNIPRYNKPANEGVGFTLYSPFQARSNYTGAFEYWPGVNQNASGTGFTQIRFTMSSNTFGSETVFSLYGYL